MVDANQSTSGNPPATGGDELQIPKHRFDEVNNRLRLKEEEMAMKDRLYLEDRQRNLAAQRQPVNAEITPEESGLEPQVHQAAVKIASKVAERMIAERGQIYEAQIGMLASRAERAELLASKGPEVSKHFPEIQQRQQEHYRATGSFLPAETAYEMIQSRGKDAEIARLKALVEAKTTTVAPAATATTTAPAATAPQETGGVPNAAGTRRMPGGGAGGGAPSPSPAGTAFGELTLQEMEARLDEQFKEGSRL